MLAGIRVIDVTFLRDVCEGRDFLPIFYPNGMFVSGGLLLSEFYPEEGF